MVFFLYTIYYIINSIHFSWRAPISYTVYAQTEHVNDSLDAIQYYRNCLPESHLIRNYVSFHIYFPVKHWTNTVQFDFIEKFNWPMNCKYYNRSRLSIKPDPGIFGTQAKPIFTSNVARNIAREAANTHFILACDIQLYPSVGFVEQFLDMLHLNRSLIVTDPDQTPRVYSIPIFEIDEAERIPRNKFELLSALKRNRAKSMAGDNNRLENWINLAANTSDSLIVFKTTFREDDYVAWEPVFVSDNNEPLFEESVPLEGVYNKRLQVYVPKTQEFFSYFFIGFFFFFLLTGLFYVPDWLRVLYTKSSLSSPSSEH